MSSVDALKKLMDEAMAKDEREKEDQRLQSLAQFRDWLNKNQEIRNCRTDDNFLLLWLRDKNYSLIETQQMFVRCLKLRQSFPQLFRNLDINDPAIASNITNGSVVVSPFKDDKGRMVCLTTIGKIDPHSCRFHDVFKSFMLTVVTIAEEQSAQVLGLIAVADMTGVSAAHAAMCPLLELATFIKVSKAIFPKSLKEVHILNMPYVVKGFVNLILSGLSVKMKNKFIFHDSLEELHKAVNAELLPQELGGSTPLSTMIDAWMKELQSKRSLILSTDDMEFLGSNKGILPDSIPSGVQGSFRKLNID